MVLQVEGCVMIGELEEVVGVLCDSLDLVGGCEVEDVVVVGVMLLLPVLLVLLDTEVPQPVAKSLTNAVPHSPWHAVGQAVNAVMVGMAVGQPHGMCIEDM